MNTSRLSMVALVAALAATSLATSAQQLTQAQPTAPTSTTLQTTAHQPQGPKTREQVQQELAQAVASGDYQLMLLWYVDPFPVDPRLKWPRP